MGSIDKEDSCLRVGIEVHIMEAIVGRAELNDTLRSGNDKYATTILAVVGDGKFASQTVGQQDIGNSVTVKVDLGATKTPYLFSDHYPFVTMDLWTLIGLVAGRMLETWVGFVERLTVD